MLFFEYIRFKANVIAPSDAARYDKSPAFHSAFNRKRPADVRIRRPL